MPIYNSGRAKLDPYPISETSRTDKSKYCHFHKSHDHKTDNHIHLKDAIESLINRGRLAEYVKEGKRYREESPKGKSPSKTVDVRTSGESNEANKGKRLYVASISRGTPWDNLHSNGTMKRKIIKMLVVHKKDGNSSVKTPD